MQLGRCTSEDPGGRGLGGGPCAAVQLWGWARSSYEKGEFQKGLHNGEQNGVLLKGSRPLPFASEPDGPTRSRLIAAAQGPAARLILQETRCE